MASVVYRCGGSRLLGKFPQPPAQDILPPMEAPRSAAAGRTLYDRTAIKKPARVSVNSDLLEKARDLGVDLDVTLEEALATEVRKRQREAWLEENREAIEAYNQHVAQHGVFSAGLRSF